ncbi:MAG: hypothetical protein ACRDPJ_14155 [Nocardioidaceae bacterium]
MQHPPYVGGIRRVRMPAGTSSSTRATRPSESSYSASSAAHWLFLPRWETTWRWHRS